MIITYPEIRSAVPEVTRQEPVGRVYPATGHDSLQEGVEPGERPPRARGRRLLYLGQVAADEAAQQFDELLVVVLHQREARYLKWSRGSSNFNQPKIIIFYFDITAQV